MHFYDDKIREELIKVAPEEKESIDGMKFGEIIKLACPSGNDLDNCANSWYSIEQSIKEDLALLRASPLIKKTTQLVGLKLDFATGVLTQVD